MSELKTASSIQHLGNCSIPQISSQHYCVNVYIRQLFTIIRFYLYSSNYGATVVENYVCVLLGFRHTRNHEIWSQDVPVKYWTNCSDVAETIQKYKQWVIRREIVSFMWREHKTPKVGGWIDTDERMNMVLYNQFLHFWLFLSLLLQ